MTDQTVTTEAPQTPPPSQQQAQPDRVTRRDLVEGNAEKVVTERTEAVTLFKGGGVDYTNLRDLVDAAKLLAASGPYLPPFMQGNVGACFANCMRAQELGVSPLALAKWTYVVEQFVGGQKVEQVAYESQMFHAVVEARAPITTRLQVAYEGEGDMRRCRGGRPSRARKSRAISRRSMLRRISSRSASCARSGTTVAGSRARRFGTPSQTCNCSTT